ncbi:MAG: RNA polymerase sigma factor [Bacteroidota bacterium]|jgi:RNA polymerase sigma factor (sigma-70 family)
MIEKKSWTDEELINGIRNDERLALSMVYKKFFKVVLKHVLNNNGTEQEAKDIYQESILALYHTVRKENFQLNCQLQTFIFSIAKRLWLKQLGRSGKMIKLEVVDHAASEPDVTEQLEAFEKKEKKLNQMNEGLNQLGEPCKTLLTDFYYNKMGMDDIAEKFGYTNADNAKNQKYKCLQRLKKYVINE